MKSAMLAKANCYAERGIDVSKLPPQPAFARLDRSFHIWLGRLPHRHFRALRHSGLSLSGELIAAEKRILPSFARYRQLRPHDPRV